MRTSIGRVAVTVLSVAMWSPPLWAQSAQVIVTGAQQDLIGDPPTLTIQGVSFGPAEGAVYLLGGEAVARQLTVVGPWQDREVVASMSCFNYCGEGNHLLVLITADGRFALHPLWLQAVDETGGGLATLDATDPITHSMSLASGRPGSVISDHRVLNRGSDLEFGSYSNDGLSSGVEGGREATLVDLGGQADVAARYGYSETVGGGQGYASIRFEADVLVIRGQNDGTYQPLLESAELFATPRPVASKAAALGHIYLVRITDRFDPQFERIAKILVVSHQPNDHVKIRWHLLRNTCGARSSC